MVSAVSAAELANAWSARTLMWPLRTEANLVLLNCSELCLAMSSLAQLIVSGVLGVVGTCAMKSVDLACSMAFVITLSLQNMEVLHVRDQTNVIAPVSLSLVLLIVCGLNGLIGPSATSCAGQASKRKAATGRLMLNMVASHVKDQIMKSSHAKSKTAQWIAKSLHGWSLVNVPNYVVEEQSARHVRLKLLPRQVVPSVQVTFSATCLVTLSHVQLTASLLAGQMMVHAHSHVVEACNIRSRISWWRQTMEVRIAQLSWSGTSNAQKRLAQ
jgi:hypothetical protein